MLPDGNCLFRAVADQVYGDPEMHADVRHLCVDYMVGWGGAREVYLFLFPQGW